MKSWQDLVRNLTVGLLRSARRVEADRLRAPARRASPPDGRATTRDSADGPPADSPTPRHTEESEGWQEGGYPGDFRGLPEMIYAPHPGNTADPGEIVWTWVPFEEDYSRGKDRPVLVIGFDEPWLLALGLTSRDHDRDAGQERQSGRDWVDIGSGGWDARGRPSEVRINRIIRVHPAGVRRIGATLDAARFRQVTAAVSADVGRQSG